MSDKRRITGATKLKLSEVQPFAEGGNRWCYVHPMNELRCIKVLKDCSISDLRAKRSYIRNMHTDTYFDDNIQEYKAYQQKSISKYSNRIYDHIPRCYGWQNTDIGQGLVLDFYPQTDGSPSPTLETYLHTHGATKEISTKLDELAEYLRQTELLTKNIIPHNVVIARDGKLKIIDGLGTSTNLSFVNFSKTARKASIERRIKRMYLRVQWEISDKNKSWLDTESGK